MIPIRTDSHSSSLFNTMFTLSVPRGRSNSILALYANYLPIYTLHTCPCHFLIVTSLDARSEYPCNNNARDQILCTHVNSRHRSLMDGYEATSNDDPPKCSLCIGPALLRSLLPSSRGARAKRNYKITGRGFNWPKYFPGGVKENSARLLRSYGGGCN